MELPDWTMELAENNTARSWQRTWPVARAGWDWYSLVETVEAETKGSHRTKQLKGKELCWLAMKWVAEDCSTCNGRNINIESIFIILARHTSFGCTISWRKQRSLFNVLAGRVALILLYLWKSASFSRTLGYGHEMFLHSFDWLLNFFDLSIRSYLTPNPSCISSPTTLARRYFEVWVHSNLEHVPMSNRGGEAVRRIRIPWAEECFYW